MKKNLKIFVKNKSIILTDKDYKASGGEGDVYRKNDIAFKIYHDVSKMIPEAKIHELNKFDRSNVLNPQNIIFDTKKKAIGFTMGFADNTEYLKRIFVKTFRNKQGITDKDVHNINTKLQETLVDIHKNKFIVADYNEMNILVGDNYTVPYHIDVDSWQTPSFKATAIMETVRDFTVPFGTFSELTDWYAWGVITFQLYTGLHPYRDGRHPNYKPKDWTKRIEDQISVFDKEVKLPSFASDFSMIPNNQLDWYKHIFQKGKRDLPPTIGKLTVGQIQSTIIVSHGKFIINKIKTYDDIIRGVYYYGGKRYVVTNSNIICNDNIKLQFKSLISGHKVELAPCIKDEPIICYQSKDKIKYMTLNRDEIGEIKSDDFMLCNGAIYVVHNGQLIENVFEKFGNIISRTKSLSNIYISSHKLFNGVVTQNILGKCWLAIPFNLGYCTNIHIPELDSVKIIDAKHDGGICIVIYEKNKKYYRTIIYFNKDFNGYDIDTKETTCSSVNFVRLPNKICVLADENKMVLFADHKQKKEVGDTPFSYDVSLYNEFQQVQFVKDKILYSVGMK